MTIHEKLLEENIKIQSYGQQKTVCPKCSHTRRNKYDTCLSINVEHDIAIWHCHHCDWKGSVYDSPNFKKKNVSHETKKNVIPFVPENKKLSDEAKIWLEKRGITHATTHFMGLYTQNEKLCFPYFYNKEIINIKFRTKDKKFHQSKDALKTLYNIDGLYEHWQKNEDTPIKKQIIFVEGEIDVLSMIEAGFTNTVSLPDGAPKEPKFDMQDKRFSAFEQSEWIFEAEEVIIATDNDEAGNSLKLELLHRFGRDICKVVHFPLFKDSALEDEKQVKDANECLVRFGKDKLKECVYNAKDFPIEDLHTAFEYKDTIQNMYDGNVQKAISTGFEHLDEIYKVMPSTFNLITGIPNHGKSNFLDQILMNLAEQQNWKLFVFSPEHSTPNHIRRLLEKRCRKPFDIGPYDRITQRELIDGMEFLNNHFKFLETSDVIPTIDYILQKAKSAKQRYGVKAVVIDPFNQISADRENNKREDEHIRDIIAKCQRFARNHQVVIFMVAHPHKLHRNDAGVLPPPDLYQVSGSAHWANMCDAGLVIHRDFEENTTKIITRKIREQGIYGEIGQREFKFNFRTRCYEKG